MMIDKKSRFVFVLALSAGVASLALAKAAPTTAPADGAVVAVSDKAALEAHKDKDVTVEGVVKEAAWSGTGKVMNVTFEDTDESKFGAVVFVKNRTVIDAAFGGDATKAWSGAKIQIHGKLHDYAGKVESRKGQPQMVITEPTQVTVVTPSTTKPA